MRILLVEDDSILGDGILAGLKLGDYAVDWVRDAFGHLKAIGFTPEAQALLDKAGVEADAGVVDVSTDAKPWR